MIFGSVIDKKFVEANYEEGSKTRKIMEEILNAKKYIVVCDSPLNELTRPISSGRCFTIFKAPKMLRKLPDKFLANFVANKVAIVFPNTSKDKVTMVSMDDYKSSEISRIIEENR